MGNSFLIIKSTNKAIALPSILVFASTCGLQPAYARKNTKASGNLARFYSSRGYPKPTAKIPMLVLIFFYSVFKIKIITNKLLAKPMRKLKAGATQTPPKAERCRGIRPCQRRRRPRALVKAKLL